MSTVHRRSCGHDRGALRRLLSEPVPSKNLLLTNGSGVAFLLLFGG